MLTAATVPKTPAMPSRAVPAYFEALVITSIEPPALIALASILVSSPLTTCI